MTNLLSALSRMAALTVLTAALPAAASHHEPADDVDPLDRTKRWDADAVTLFACSGEPHVSDEDLLVALSLAAVRWNDVGAGPHIEIAGAEGCSGPLVTHDGVSRVGFLNDEPWTWPANAAAVTSAFRRSSTEPIVEADIALNPAIAWTLDAVEDRGSFDLWNVLGHELGHVLGLPDIKDPPSATMFYMTRRGDTSKRDLAPEDTAMLLQLYEGIDDASPGCSAAGTPVPVATVMVLLAARLRRRTTRQVG